MFASGPLSAKFSSYAFFRVFFISVSTSIGTNKECIYIKGASQTFGDAVTPNCPLDSSQPDSD